MEPYGGDMTLLLDNPQQVRFLEDALEAGGLAKKWKAFVKVNGGTKFVHYYHPSPHSHANSAAVAPVWLPGPRKWTNWWTQS